MSEIYTRAGGEVSITSSEMAVLAHSLGIRENQTEPAEFFRGYYHAGETVDDDLPDNVALKSLESKGLMVRRNRGADMGGIFFFVTDAGRALFRTIRWIS